MRRGPVRTVLSLALVLPMVYLVCAPLASVAETRRWRTVLDVRADGTRFHGFVQTSPRNAWALGERDADRGGNEQVAYHWDGGRWRLTPLRAKASQHGYFGLENGTRLSASHDRNAWLVLPGEFEYTLEESPGCGGSHQALERAGVRRASRLLRWDGSGWRDALRVEDVVLTSVAAVGAGEAWAFGEGLDGPVVLRYDGAGWSRRAGPARVDDAKADGAGAWAVGTSVETGQPGIWHFGGARTRHIPFGRVHPSNVPATEEKKGRRTASSSLAVLDGGEIAVSGVVFVQRGCVTPEWATLREFPYQLLWNGFSWKRERGFRRMQLVSQASDGRGGRYAAATPITVMSERWRVLHRTASGRWTGLGFPGRNPASVFRPPGAREVHVSGADERGAGRGLVARFSP